MSKRARRFSVKDRIEHAVFGAGTIVEVNERHTTIAFDEGEARKFMTGVVKLARSDAGAPATPTRTVKTTKR